MTPEHEYILGVFVVCVMVHVIRPKSDLLTILYALVGWLVNDWDAFKVASIVFIVALLIDSVKGLTDENRIQI